MLYGNGSGAFDPYDVQYKSKATMEGIVTRNAEGYAVDDFAQKIREGHSIGLDSEVLSKLGRNLLISPAGAGKSQKYVLVENYQTLVIVPLLIGSYRALDLTTLIKALALDNEVRIGVIVKTFDGKLTRYS